MSVSNKKIQLIQILQKKTRLLSSVLQITRAQKLYIEDEDAEKLLSELDTRQKLIDEILNLDKTIDRVYLNQLIGEGDPQAVKLDNEIRLLLKNIAEEDKRNIREAEEKVTEYKNEIKNLKSEKERLNKYTNGSAYSDGIFIDKKK